MSVDAFTILGEVPDGGPGSETAPALRGPIHTDSIPEVLRSARDAILTATGPRDGTVSGLNVHQFDGAIRSYMPLGHYERAPSQPISVMDYKMYACRLVHRVLNQVTGGRVAVGGAYNSHLATNARANALYETLLDIAAQRQIPGFVASGWEERLTRARQNSPRASTAETIDAARAASERARIEALVQAEVARRLSVVERAPTSAPSDDLPAPTWVSMLIEEGPRKVFLHLDEHGSATEEEVTLFLGSPRAFRQFSVRFEEYAQQVPFKVRIETGTDGKRYVKVSEG